MSQLDRFLKVCGALKNLQEPMQAKTFLDLQYESKLNHKL